jgi:hypothetical protein
MEGFRQRDEYEHMKVRLPPPETPLELIVPVIAQLRVLSPAELDGFQTVLNGATYRSFLDGSPQSDLEAATTVLALIEKGFVRKP